MEHPETQSGADPPLPQGARAAGGLPHAALSTGTPLPVDEIIRHTPIGIAVIDRDGLYCTVNPAYCTLFGYDPAELLGRSFMKVFAPAQHDRVLALHHAFFDAGDDMRGEWEVVRRDGGVLTITSDSVRLTGSDGRPCRLVYVLDITERRQAQEAVRRSEAMLRDLAASIPGALFRFASRTSGPWRFLYVSPGIQTLFEVTPQQACCDKDALRGCIVPEDRAAHDASIRASIANQGPWEHEYRIRTRSGVHKWIHARAEPKPGDAGEMIWTGVLTDVSDRKRIEAELKQLDQELREQAATDFQTGAANRRTLMERLKLEYERVRRHSLQRCSVLALDLDRFKHVNDTWGHAAGDAALVHVTRLIRAETRMLDLVGRIGGDEFLLLLPDTGLEEAFTLAERLRRRVATTPLSYAEHAIALTVSIGVSGIAAGDADVDAVLARADHALYEAKNAGRDTVRAAAAPVATPAGTAPSPR